MRIPFYSIIVPIYNTLRDLPKCVSSVLSQSFVDLELILVDDGSTDGSGALCDTLAAQDNRVEVLHQSNSGPAAARNLGMAHATGEHVLFLDSDDYYPDPHLLERLSTFSADLVCFNYARLHDDGSQEAPLLRVPGPLPKDTGEALAELVRRGAFTSSPCLKRVRATLLRAAGLCFPEGLLSEDVAWNGRLMAAVESVAWCGDAVYVYRVRDGSITRSISQEHVEDLFSVVEALANLPLTRRSDAFKKAFRGYLAFQFCTLLINVRFAKREHLASNLGRCKLLKPLLRYGLSRSARLVRVAVALFGVRGGSFLLFHYFRLTGR